MFVKIIIALVATLGSCFADASATKSAGRYSQVTMAPTAENIDPLKQLVVINFPRHITTVEAAIRFVTKPTGYHLPSDDRLLDKAFLTVGAKPLPISQRRLKGTVAEVVSVLVGNGFVLVRDDVRRLIVLDYIGREF